MLKVVKKSICLFFAIVMLMLCFPANVFAVGTTNPMHSTSVIDDLESLGYDISDYYKDSSADWISVIDVTEYGYDYYGDQRYYGLYFYIYNPSGREILDGNNAVELSFVDKANIASQNTKYALEKMSVSLEENYEYVLYKLYVSTSRDIGEKINQSIRTYNVSAMELQFDDAPGAKPESFKIAGKYRFSGYQKNFGISPNDDSTLYCGYEKFDVVSSEIHDASWFSNTSDLGEDYRYELSSVYFSIPDYFIEKYGNVDDDPDDGGTSGLYSVRGEYYKYVTDGLLLSDADFYEKTNLSSYAGVHLSTQSSWSNYTLGEGSVGFFTDCSYNSDGDPSYHYDLSYNMYIGSYAITYLTSKYYTSDDINSHICNVLLSDSTDVSYVSKKSFLEQYNAQGRNHYGDTGGLSTRNSTTFTNLGYKPYEVKVDQASWNSAIKSFSEKYKDNGFKWLHKLFNKDLYVDENGYAEIDPIIELTSDSFRAGDGGDDDVSEKLFVMSEDVPALEEFYDEMDYGNHIYLMRFDVNPYYAPQVTVTSDVIKGEQLSPDTCTGYYFEKVVYHDFDILEFTFKDKDGGYHTVPVECKPIDIVGSVIPGNNQIQPNPNNPDGSGSNGIFDENPLLKVIIALLVLIVVIVIIYFLSKPIVAIFKGIGSATDRRYKNYDVKQQMKEDNRAEREARRAKRAEKKAKKAAKGKRKYDSPSADFEKKYSSPAVEMNEFKKKPGRKPKEK